MQEKFELLAEYLDKLKSQYPNVQDQIADIQAEISEDEIDSLGLIDLGIYLEQLMEDISDDDGDDTAILKIKDFYEELIPLELR